MSKAVRVKMCGMTRLEDISHAVDLGVDAIGFIFYPQSARHVSIDQVRPWIKNLAPFVDVVAVLVNPHQDFVYELINELPIHLLQFHGDESPQFCRQFNKPFIKTIHPSNTNQIQEAILNYSGAQAILLDTPSATQRGGTGLSFNWQLIPPNVSKPIILAGGLNASNVVNAVLQCKPYAVDVCSGIEQAAGIKNHKTMTQFIKALWGGS